MGCASIPLGRKSVPALSALLPSMAVADGVEQVGAIWHALAAHLSSPEWRVFPKTPFAALPEATLGKSAELPPLIKSYLRLGAQVCGEPAWDPAFNVADLFLMLSLDQLSARYAQQFVSRL
jgi:putative hemolysin